MKVKVIAVAVLAALAAVAMPTKDEIAQANKEVQASLKKQIAAWQSGDLSQVQRRAAALRLPPGRLRGRRACRRCGTRGEGSKADAVRS